MGGGGMGINTTGQSWGALRKAWKGYRIAKTRGERVLMTKYAYRIRKLQTELGISVADFPLLSIQGPRDEGEEQRQKNIEKETAGKD